MRKMALLVLVLMAAAPALAAPRNVIANGDFNGTANWANWGNGYWPNPGETGAGTIAMGWVDGATIGQDTGHKLKPNTKYVFTVTLKTINQAGGQAEGATLVMQSNPGSGLTDIVRETFLFPAEYNFGAEPFGEASPWLDYSISFDTAVRTDLVGQSVLVAIAVSDTQGWDEYGNLFLDQASLLVEEATEPTPANGPTVPTVTEKLSWLNPDNVQKCDLYFGSAPDANESNYKTKLTKYVISSPTQAPARQEYAMPITLVNNTKYTWVVDCYRGTPAEPNIPNGGVWTFTATELALFQTNPANQLKGTGETAEFAGVFTSVSPAAVKWYKEAGETDIQMVIGGDITITTTNAGDIYTSTLKIANAAIEDEGQYYCQATNSGGPNPSAAASLTIKRLMAYWTLDQADFVGGQYLDKSTEDATADNATAGGTPVFTAGAKGDAVTIDAMNGWATAGTWNPSADSGQITASCWVKWAGAGGNQVIFSKANNWNNPGVMWQITCGGDGGIFVMGTSSQVGLPAGTLKANEWQLIAFTFNGTTGAIYSVSSQATGLTLPVDSGNFAFGQGVDSTIWIGARGYDSPTVPIEQFAGQIDEVKIFNYAKSTEEVADLYNEVYTKNFCVKTYPSTADLDGNCKINLLDFAEFAKGWLECGLYPVCP